MVNKSCTRIFYAKIKCIISGTSTFDLHVTEFFYLTFRRDDVHKIARNFEIRPNGVHHVPGLSLNATALSSTMSNSTSAPGTLPEQFTVPPFLPPALGFICSVVAGLTSFGDAIMWHVLWALCGAIGLISTSSRESLTKAVLYLTVMPLANLPIGLYVSRKQLWPCAPYGFTMAVTGLCFVSVGAWLLFHADLTALKIGVGIFFISFSVLKLTSSVAGWGLKRQEKRAGATASATASVGAEAPPAAALQPLSGNSEGATADLSPVDTLGSEVAVNALRSSQVKAGAAPAPETAADEWAKVEPIGGWGGYAASTSGAAASSAPGLSRTASAVPGAAPAPAVSSASILKSTPACNADANAAPPARLPAFLHPVWRLWRRVSTRLSPISPRYAPGSCLGILFATGTASGLLGGMMGTGGPPQMMAFAVLAVDKDVIRGVSMVYGLLETGLRVVMFTTGAGSPFDANEWPIYAGIAVASWAGFAAGTFLRRWADTEAIIRLLLLLVFMSSAILLGALQDRAVAAVFVVAGIAWLVSLAYVFRKPQRYVQCMSSIGRTLRAIWRSCCSRAAAPSAASAGSSASHV